MCCYIYVVIYMKKNILIVAILGIIVVLIGFLFWPNSEPANNNQPQNPPTGGEGIQINSPKGNEEISSPFKIIGVVNGNGWGGFEGQVGTVKLLDNNGNQLGATILTAITDWMQPVINFETYLQFLSDKDQDGKLVFLNENPSGLPDKNKEFILPVKIKNSSGEIIKVKVYFNNSKMDPEYSCNKVFSVDREIPEVEAVGSAALWELLKGPTENEKNDGFFTSINQGVEIQSLKIENGTAYVDFDEQLEYQVGGSCRVSAIRAEITQTLKQFSTIENVIISVNGRTEDILQP